jgi:hypothetical protein
MPVLSHVHHLCNDLTATLLHRSKRSLPHWILATFLLCLACSPQRIARELGIHLRTSYRIGTPLKHRCWNVAPMHMRRRRFDTDDL